MKLLLEIDESVYYYNGTYYASYEGQNDFFNRYLRIFDSLKVVCRCEHVDSIKEINLPLDANRIQIVPVPMFRGIVSFLKMKSTIRKCLKDVAYDCDCGVLRIPSSLALQACKDMRKKKIPYAVEIVYDAKDGYRSADSILEHIAWMYQHHIMKNMAAHAVGVACVTEFYLQKHYFSKVKNSFTANYSTLALPKSFYSAPRSFPYKKVYIISHIANQIIFNGRKGHNEVIDAIAILKEKGLNVQVQFAGGDYDNGISILKEYAVKKGVSDRVVFVGFLSREELEGYLEESDIYVMPTRAEGLPRVIIESMAKGLPCLTTDVSGNSELVDKEMMFDFDNPAELADKIEHLLKTPVLYEQVSRTNFDRSKNYEASILELRRDDFYGKLKNWR